MNHLDRKAERCERVITGIRDISRTGRWASTLGLRPWDGRQVHPAEQTGEPAAEGPHVAKPVGVASAAVSRLRR